MLLDYWRLFSLCKKLDFCISLLLHNKSVFWLETFKQHLEFRMESPCLPAWLSQPQPHCRPFPVFFQVFSMCVPESHALHPNLHLRKGHLGSTCGPRGCLREHLLFLFQVPPGLSPQST